ncbi:hypothetical protein [Lentzea sp. NBRC 102530]|uniref:hypothetical protein n=1 Tax=Lentzea sp. NBRC 102530 TaxID=3032201 RepID=UPI0024A4A2FD|nr:hypothetical protein [Lentzea sp. NBRC 102530]GLY47687.1 hypothetical protein Lesp01_13430 [Lentzea sp. NBRC 102530]
MNDAWHEFRREVFGDPYLVWHEGADVDALVNEHAREPERAERMLRAGLGEGDHVAVESLGALARAGRAPSDTAAVLRSALPSAEGTLRVRIAQVLHEMTGDDEHVSEVVAVLEGGGHWGDRIHAALALAALPSTPRSVAALHRGVLDPEYLVRYHCGNGLLGLTGARADIAKHRGFTRLSGDDPVRHRAVADELRSASSVRTAGVYGDRGGFAVELGAADHSAPHLRSARVHAAGVRLSGPDRVHVPALRNLDVVDRDALERLGFVDVPESFALDQSTTDELIAALDFDFDVARWGVTDLLIGDRVRFAVEIGPVDPLGPRLRTCTVWLDNAVVTPFDNTAYVPAFVHSLRADIAGRSAEFGRWGPTTEDLSARREPDGTVRYRLRSRIDGVGDREGVVRLRANEVVEVLRETVAVLTAGQ